MLRMMSPKEPFSRVVYFTEKIKPHYIVDEYDQLVNPKNQVKRVASSIRPQISVNGAGLDNLCRKPESGLRSFNEELHRSAFAKIQ